jgi:hypothetical protein
MLRSELAQQLRERQYQKKLVAQAQIDTLTDDQIIDAYITCSRCGEKQVADQQLPTLIARANNANHFLQLCDQNSAPHQVH